MENSFDGCGKGYIEERAYLSTITRAIFRAAAAAAAHQDVVRSASSYRKRNLIVEAHVRRYDQRTFSANPGSSRV
jgi:hypothetical protein